MGPLRRPRRHLVTVLAVLALALSACGEEVVYHPPVGVSDTNGPVDALSLTVVTNRLGAATLVGTLYNEGPVSDRLLDVTATSPSTSDPITVTVRGGAVELPPLVPVELADRSAVTLTTSDFREGAMVNLTLTFAQAPPISILVLIYPQEGMFSEVPVPRPPTPAVGP